ncbi:MAG: hypothetical protein KDI07_15755 [Anaerolineae bacterium]|nr:hypothetical protein [Anaerolineae bacterium]MCB0232083.1 hypothetical protein [Anaerolineae bacterium]MCB0235061.1 hypothetical protein [Anaerolineae bacterium]MCB0238519.1 hypothetical protein [Anaerolineae bacterium]MCB0241892.1 hypothetical protein [Anaerolineae bacterium]
MNVTDKKRSFTAITLVLLALLTITGAAGASGNADLLPPSGAIDSPVASSRGFSTNFHYEYVAGAALRPRDSSSGWDYSGTGCVSRSSGSELFNIYLGLPDGSRIDYLRIYYYDTSGSDSTAWVTSYNSTGGYTDITTVQSAGTGGYGTKLSSYVGHVVDNSSRSYVLNWSAAQNGSSMRLCGLRVAYRVPTLDLFMPLITKG